MSPALKEKEERHGQHRGEAGIDPQFHIAVAHQICRREEKRGPRHRLLQPPVQRRRVDNPRKPTLACPWSGRSADGFIERLHARSVVTRQFAEGEPQHRGGGQQAHRPQRPGSNGPASSQGVVETGKPRGRQQPDPPRIQRHVHFATDAANQLRRNLAGEHHGDRHQDLCRCHQRVQPLAAEPAKAELIHQHHATRAEQRFEEGRDRVRHGIKPAAVRGADADQEAGQVEGSGQPERHLHEHSDLRPEQGARRHGPMHQDVRLLLVEEHFTRRGRDEHSEEHQRHRMEIHGEREDRLAQEHQRHQAEQRIE